MDELEISIAVHHDAWLPEYETRAASGVDLRAFITEPVVLAPMERALIPTGLFVGIPEGFEAEVRPRSGLAYKHGITLLNTPGTIDADYRGEIKIILINLGRESFTVNRGDRIAQMVFKQVFRARWRVVEELPETQRGTGGFGSTGI